MHMFIMNSQTQHVRGILVVAILSQVPTVECSPCFDITTLELMTLYVLDYLRTKYPGSPLTKKKVPFRIIIR